MPSGATLNQRSKALLLDLDGTLLDTAPDLTAALNVLLREKGRPELSVEQVRPVVPDGAAALVQLGFGPLPAEPAVVLCRQLVEVYAQAVSIETRLFEGFDALLRNAEEASIPWGVVTNKLEHLTVQLLTAQGLVNRARCIVGGDTVAQQKPHPAPLLHAARQLNLPPADCVYVGDSERDIQAGRAAGMRTVAARYGYIRAGHDVSTWKADAIIDHPLQLRRWLDFP